MKGKRLMVNERESKYLVEKRLFTSNLSSLALWFLGSCLNSSVKRRHSWMFSGETKSTATLVHDCERIYDLDAYEDTDYLKRNSVTWLKSKVE